MVSGASRTLAEDWTLARAPGKHKRVDTCSNSSPKVGEQGFLSIMLKILIMLAALIPFIGIGAVLLLIAVVNGVTNPHK